ncbi:hypothetical protein V8C86DRAFT_2527880 [Haematococcus lacustris]|nr:hypothetical protein QJQ45_019585 [Haematococcus lacustris]
MQRGSVTCVDWWPLKGHLRPSLVLWLPKLPKPSRSPVSRLHALPTTSATEAPIKLPYMPVIVSSKAYLGLQMVVLLAQLALVDAAYSGDWVRVGVISTDVEQVLQKVVLFIAVAHCMVGVITAYVAPSRGANPLTSGLKAVLFGTMELYKVWQRPQVS